jgi:hypothetical protein
MALVVNDRVKETSTTTGTGTFDLAGAVSGFESFATGIGNTNTTYYAIVNENGEFEVGLGTVTDAAQDTLSRDTIISSSNSDSAVNFSAGTKDVFCTLPASKAVILDSSGNIKANNGSNLTNLNATNLASGTVDNARLPDPISDKVINASRPLTIKGDGASADGQLILNCSQNSHGVKITSPAHSANATWEWILPVNDGTAGQVLTTDGNAQAQLSWTTPEVGDITSVVAGSGLTGGGTTGDVTLNVGAGALIDVTADAIDVDLSELTTSTSDADGDFFAVVDSANAQKKLTKGNIAISGFNNDSGFIDGSALNASNLSSGTVPDARFPATLPALNGSALTNLNASNLASGTVANARLDAQLQDVAGLATTAGKIIQGDGSNFILSAFTLPTADGSANQVLQTDGSGAVTFATISADITAVTAGNGLTGGGASGDVTLNVGAGTGIDVAADAISVDVSDFMTNGSDNRIITATGTDAMNAEANLTFDGSTLAVTGALTTTGNTTTDHVLPNTNDTFDLGASGNVWRNVYTGDLHLTNESKEEGNAVDGTKGNWTIQEGAEHLFILNNKSGKKYRFKLEEI